MDIDQVKDLVNQFDQSSLRELLWQTGNDRLSLSKNEPQAAAGAQNLEGEKVLPQPSDKSSLHIPPATSDQPTVGAHPTEKGIDVKEGEVVSSPLVGVAYLKPAPDKPDFVSVGDQVKKGQTLLIIEAMKVMNEIPAPSDGTITEIMVKSEQVAQFGQALVRIK